MKLGRTFLAGLFAAVLAAPAFATDNQSTLQNQQPQASALQTQQQGLGSTQTSEQANQENQHQNKAQGTASEKTASNLNSPININTATVQDLKSVKGVGQKRAEAIVKYRDANGNFASLDDLAKVKGISQKWVEKNRTHLTIGDSSPVAAG